MSYTPSNPARRSTSARLVAVASIAAAIAVGTVHADGAPDTTAFVGVHVLPMDAERVLRDHTVVVVDETIVALGPRDRIALPNGARVIDGKGKWLIPGLADMHVHSWDALEDNLFVAHGVTTIRNLFGSDTHRRWSRKGRSDPGPRMLTTAPILDGDPPVWPSSAVAKTPGEARKHVRDQAGAGFRWIKVYSRLSREAYLAAMDEAAKTGTPVTGHVPSSVGLLDALAAGQGCIEHLDGYTRGMQSDDSPLRTMSAQERASLGYEARQQLAAKHADPAKLPDLVRRTVGRGVWNTPTLLVYDRLLASAETKNAWFESERMDWVSPFMKRFWNPENDFRLKDRTEEQLAAARERATIRDTIFRALVDGGAPILAGTDSGNPFIWPGYSLHEELSRMVEAGMTPYAALESATSAPARYLGESDRFGRVAVGLRADLVLLERDPLARIEHTRTIVGTMIGGAWYDRAALDGLLGKVTAAYGGD